jgi:hypothetical protein
MSETPFKPEQYDPRLQTWDQWTREFQPQLSPQQQATYDAERKEVERLWEGSVGDLLNVLLSKNELEGLGRELATYLSPVEIEKEFGRPTIELPTMFALEPDRPIQLEIYRKIEPLRGPLYELVCEKWDYCAKRDWVAGGLGGALALLAFILSGGVTTGVPLAGVIVGGIRAGYFDRLCECGVGKPGGA